MKKIDDTFNNYLHFHAMSYRIMSSVYTLRPYAPCMSPSSSSLSLFCMLSSLYDISLYAQQFQQRRNRTHLANT